MDWQIPITFAVLGLVVLALAVLPTGPDLILLAGLTLLLVFGVVEPSEALSGFANEGLVTVAVLFVIAEGLRQTGALIFFGQRVLGRPASLVGAQTRVMLPAALMSAFLNNTPVVAMLMPIVSDWARKFRLSVSHLLLPLNYATILGGLCTLIGTSTTLIVNGLLLEQERRGLLMFEIALVGLPIAIAGILYMLIFAQWLLKERKPPITPLDDPREYTVEMLVEPNSPLVNKTIEEAGLRHLPNMYLMEIDRDGQILAAVSPQERLKANDRLVFVGIVESIVDLHRIPGLAPATDQQFQLDGPRSERCLIEAVVSNSCPFVRVTIRESRFRSNYNAAVIAVARNGERIRKKIGDIELLPGDTLLLEADPSFIERQRNSRDFFLVSEVADSMPLRHERAGLARAILVMMIVPVAVGWISMLKAAMLAAGLMIATRCCRGTEARRSIDWGVILAIGAGLGIGRALETSGAAQVLAATFIGWSGDDPYLALAVIYGVTMLLTNVITNNAAAVLVFPIAMATADRIYVDGMPFAVAIMVAASASFATPLGYQTNLMVYGPGGYRFSDYFRFGAPLSLVVWAMTVAITPIVWPFHP